MRLHALVGLLLVATLATRASAAPDDRFETKIRPVLAEHCLKCHGPDKQASGLRLDSRAAMLKGGSGEGPAIVPGDPEGSPLVRAVRQDGEVKMPPKGQLPEPAIRELSEWIKAGAVWPETALTAKATTAGTLHWSFQPIKKADPPVKGVGPIDGFLNAGIASAGLVPAPRADRRTLIRRASFDLTGLPPQQEDIDAFLTDPRPDREAFAAVVESLLASPHYGERWGRQWLDVARYADTKGYVFAEDRNYPFAYTYRDWVVDALNDDLPYDQFVTQQIAADKLPAGSDNGRLAAMGFLTVGRRFLQDQNEIIDDRIDVVTRGLLGLSVSCARCHDHKFDPIPTEDYYSLYGVFNSSDEPKELPLLGASTGDKGADYQKKLAERRKAVDTFLNERRAAIEKELRGKLPAYLLAAEELNFDPRAPKLDEVARSATLKPETLRRLIIRWKGRADAGDPRFAPWKAFATIAPGDWRKKAPDALAAIKAANTPKPTVPPTLLHALTSSPPGSRKEVTRRYGDLLARAIADPPDASLADLRAWLDGPDGPIRVADGDLRRAIPREDRNKLRALDKKLAELDASHPGAPARAMVMVDKPQPAEPHVFLRGNPGRPGPQVPRRFLKVLSTPDRPKFTEGSGRIDLARAITRPDNPLTSRVMVNRLWQGHFGRGIVGTPSDFGLRGDPPTHPELLDWLAARFVEGGWSIKAIHRLIMASDAYARVSNAAPEAVKVDPRNLKLSHQNRRRLDFESMRDALLSASGRLDPAVGGKPVALETEPFTTRRAIYGMIDRYNLEPVYRTFDFPNPDTSSPRRLGTIVPQQALYLLNSPFVVEQAKGLAARPEVAAGKPEDRVTHLYRRILGRDPAPHEVEIATRYLARPRPVGDEGPGSPWQYGTGGLVESPGKPASVEFRRFPHWTGKVWQREAKLPTADGDYANLHNDGGHPGPDVHKGTVLRWVAPADVTVALGGTIDHPAKAGQGDGVRARVVSSRAGLLGTWVAQANKVETHVDRVEVRRGEILDFLVDCRAEAAFDSYQWSPTIGVVAGPKTGGPRRSSWAARDGFHGPEPAALAPWEALAQALLLTNEFLYID